MYPSYEEREVEFIGVVAASFYLNQLNCRSFTAYGSVKGRCEKGSEKAVYAVGYCILNKVFHNSPVLLTENGHLIVGSKAVCVEPVYVNKPLSGKGCFTDFYFL